MLSFVRRLIAIYNEEPTLHRRRFFHGKSLRGEESPEIAWLDPIGKEMSDEAVEHARTCAASASTSSAETSTSTNTATPIIGDHLLILFNADHATEIPFALPKVEGAGSGNGCSTPRWMSSKTMQNPTRKMCRPPPAYKLAPCSMVVFRAEVPKDPETNITR